jgi:N-acetylmuramoyl-L-alanine amidase
LTTRQVQIRKAGCQYSISVHFNAFGDGRSFNLAEGVGTYYHSKDEIANDSKALATIIQKHLATGMVQKNRGVNRASFAMVNCLNLKTKASILVELAFMTNKKEAVSMMGNAAFWRECAIEISKGFCEYLKVDYIAEEEADNENETSIKKVIYIVQVGAFQTLTTAETIRDKAKKAGYRDAYIKPIAVNKKMLYAVLVGAYSVKENATVMLSKVQHSGFDGIIKKY